MVRAVQRYSTLVFVTGVFCCHARDATDFAGLGSFPMLIFVTLISIASVIFVGGSSTRGPKGVYSTPPAGGVRMGVFTIVLTLISLPMTVIINR